MCSGANRQDILSTGIIMLKRILPLLACVILLSCKTAQHSQEITHMVDCVRTQSIIVDTVTGFHKKIILLDYDTTKQIKKIIVLDSIKTIQNKASTGNKVAHDTQPLQSNPKNTSFIFYVLVVGSVIITILSLAVCLRR